MVSAWEASIKAKGTPLLTFYENWNKINRIQKRKKITKNDEMAEELPVIKRVKKTDEMAKAKSESKGPMVLFPSDSEDGEGNLGFGDISEEKNKTKQKKLKKTKKTKRKIVSVDNDNTKEEADVVKDFDAKDW